MEFVRLFIEDNLWMTIDLADHPCKSLRKYILMMSLYSIGGSPHVGIRNNLVVNFVLFENT